MKVTIMYRNNWEGGDGWTFYPITVEISDFCPVCGEKRGTPIPYRFCDDGDYYVVDVWINPCGHVDSYKNIYLNEVKPNNKSIIF